MLELQTYLKADGFQFKPHLSFHLHMIGEKKDCMYG